MQSRHSAVNMGMLSHYGTMQHYPAFYRENWVCRCDSGIFIPFVNLLQVFLLVPLHIHKVYIFSKDYLHLISLGDFEVKLALHVITVYCYCAPFRPFQTLLDIAKHSVPGSLMSLSWPSPKNGSMHGTPK